MNLVVVLSLMLGARASASPPEKPPVTRFSAVATDDAWALLPRENPPLPPWSKMTVGALPRTTAAMLELDYFHRVKNPLGPALSAFLRWTAADTLNSEFGRATAEADMRRAGVPTNVMAKLGQPGALPADVHAAVAFGRKLTLEGHAITDAEFAQLLRIYGPEQVTAIVHTVAYANFHNRIVLGLGATGAAVAPVDVQFSAERMAKVPTPVRPPWDDLDSVKAGGLSVRVNWSQATADKLNTSLEQQKVRKFRIPLPDPSLIKALPTREREQAERVVWSAISSGYQPEMPRVWFAALSSFYEEAKVDRVFTNSVFWVVTRTNDCFY